MHPMGLDGCAAVSCLLSWALPRPVLGGRSPPQLLQEGWMRPGGAVMVKVMDWGHWGSRLCPTCLPSPRNAWSILRAHGVGP